MKVLHILNGLGFGGAETWLLEIIKKNQGVVQFDFLLTGGVERELDKEFTKLGCRLHYVRFSGKRIVPFCIAINRVVRSGKYTVIHDHEDFVAGWHWLYLIFNLPAVRIAHAHNSMIYINNYAKSAGRKFFYKAGKILNALLATKITGTSDKLMQELGYNKAIYKRKRIEPLYCGTEPGLFVYSDSSHNKLRQQFGFEVGDKLVIFIGRIGLERANEINHKNPELAFALAQRLVKEDPSYKFIFVGEKGRLAEFFEQEINAQKMENNIFFLGKRKDINQLLIASDLMLFTSILEPFGVVLIEAQFSALPLVSSDIITRETVVFPELFQLLNVVNADIDEWVEAIKKRFGLTYDRQSFTKKNEDRIAQSIFSTENSYRRLIHHYRN